MELFLNLFWILLALPAYWVFRRGTRTWQQTPRLVALRAGLILGCMLMLLFPFVSATDDLHAMRPDMEESSGKCLRDGGSEKARVAGGIAPLFHWNPYPSFVSASHVVGWVIQESASASAPVLLTTRPGRAPPSFLLG